MSHAIEPGRVSFNWGHQGAENSIMMTVHGDPHEVEGGSEAEFITEHYWGYTAGRNGRTMEYEVTHPRWRVWAADQAQFKGDVAGLYGRQFVEALSGAPASAFLAEGSQVTVYKGVRLP
jgi:hypothetical protein